MTDTENSADREWMAGLRRRGRAANRRPPRIQPAAQTDKPCAAIPNDSCAAIPNDSCAAIPNDSCAATPKARSFGEIVRDKRLIGGLSRKQLAALSGVSEEAIRLIEEGRTVKPSERTVLALIDVPDLALEYKDCPPHIQRLGTLGGSDAFQRYQLRELHYSCARTTYQELLKSWDTLPEPTLSDAREWIGKRLAEIEYWYEIRTGQRQAQNESLGRQVQMKRLAAELTRLQLAELSGLSECTIKLIEKGKTQPTERTLLLLLRAKKLGLLLTDLPEPDLRRMRKYFRKQERDSLEPYIHLLFWRQRLRRQLKQKREHQQAAQDRAAITEGRQT